MSADRDLAEAIYRELCSEATAAAALDLWQHRRLGPNDRWDMGGVLRAVSRHAIDRVLARRQNLAARTGPWEKPHSAPIKDAGPGFAAFLSREMSCQASGCHWQWFAERMNEDGQGRDHYVWCRGCGSAYPWRDTYYLRRLFEAGEAARTGPWEGGHHAQEEPGYPGSLLPKKRGAP
jgi:hypothetical protein